MRRGIAGIVLASVWLMSGCSQAPPQAARDLEERVAKLETAVTDLTAALARRKRNPATSTIILSKSSSSGPCDTAKVLDYRVGNTNERHVRWNIEDECNLGGQWHLRLVFAANGAGQYPFPSQTIMSRANGRFIQDRIKRAGDVDQGVYTYTIFLVRGTLPPVELADPELEVEPPI